MCDIFPFSASLTEDEGETESELSPTSLFPEQPFPLAAEVSISLVCSLFSSLWMFQVLQGCLWERGSLCKEYAYETLVLLFLLCAGINMKSSDFHPCWSQSNRNISVLLALKKVAGPHWCHLYQNGEGVLPEDTFVWRVATAQGQHRKDYAEKLIWSELKEDKITFSGRASFRKRHQIKQHKSNKHQIQH